MDVYSACYALYGMLSRDVIRLLRYPLTRYKPFQNALRPREERRIAIREPALFFSACLLLWAPVGHAWFSCLCSLSQPPSRAEQRHRFAVRMVRGLFPAEPLGKSSLLGLGGS